MCIRLKCQAKRKGPPGPFSKTTSLGVNFLKRNCIVLSEQTLGSVNGNKHNKRSITFKVTALTVIVCSNII